MAERSKALRSGRSLERGVGSNPTSVILFGCQSFFTFSRLHERNRSNAADAAAAAACSAVIAAADWPTAAGLALAVTHSTGLLPSGCCCFAAFVGIASCGGNGGTKSMHEKKKIC